MTATVIQKDRFGGRSFWYVAFKRSQNPSKSIGVSSVAKMQKNSAQPSKAAWSRPLYSMIHSVRGLRTAMPKKPQSLVKSQTRKANTATETSWYSRLPRRS